MKHTRGIGRRGQTALEFLGTYGWTALMMLFFIGVMAYFGLINAGALVPARCDLPEGIGIDCLAAEATTDGRLTLNLYFEEGTVITGFSCRYDGEQRVTTRSATQDGSALGPALGFVQVACLFDGDNPFAGKAGEKVEITAMLELTGQEPIIHDALVRAPVEQRR